MHPPTRVHVKAPLLTTATRFNHGSGTLVAPPSPAPDASAASLGKNRCAHLCGATSAASVQELAPNNVWQGPLRSDFGMHLVRVSELVESTQPEFDDIRADVLSALVTLRRFEANDAEYQKLRNRYEVVFNLPELPVEAGDAAAAK